MTPTETATILRKFREWRRDDDYILPQPDPRKVGKAIDAAIEMIESAEEERALCDKLAGILTRTANVLKGEPKPLHRHSWHDLPEVAQRLVAAPGAQPAPSLPDTHNDMVVGLDYQGAMSCARQRAKKEAGLLYPEGDARKEEKERELASEYYRQYTTPNPGAKP